MFYSNSIQIARNHFAAVVPEFRSCHNNKSHCRFFRVNALYLRYFHSENGVQLLFGDEILLHKLLFIFNLCIKKSQCFAFCQHVFFVLVEKLDAS